jgi:thiol-disulfide isomerase/thioredoxin
MRLRISFLLASTLTLAMVCVAVLAQQQSSTATNSRAPRPFVADGINKSGDIREINLDDLKKMLQRDGKDTRPLLVNFWATWCDPCREEFPDLVKVDADYRDKGLNFIAISLDDVTDIKSAVPKFLNEMKAKMSVVLLNVNDPEPAIKAVDPTWDGQLPATFLYDKDGKIVFKHFGRIQPAELRSAIDKQVSGKQ